MQSKAFIMGAGLSCLAVCGGACAQSTVTIGGYLDAAVLWQNHGGATQLGSLGGGSDIVLSGSEDLGGGTTAVFRLATRFNLDTGTPVSRAYFHEESTVGLKGSFGTLRFGRALTALWNNDWHYDPWYNFDRVASPAWQLWHGNSPSSPNSPIGGAPGTVGLAHEFARLNNGLYYTSPTLAGFHADVSVEIEKNADDPLARKRNLSAALMYDAGGFSAMLAAERNALNNKVYFAAAKYNFGNATVFGGYDYERAPAGSPYFTGKDRNRSATLGFSYALGTTTVNLGYGRQIDTHADYYSAGLVHYLSKRTSLQLSVGYFGKQLWGATASRMAYGAGMTHSF